MILALALGLAMQAQTTTCNTAFGTTTCNTYRPASPPAPANGFDSYIAARNAAGANRGERPAADPEDCADGLWLLACTRGQHEAALAVRNRRIRADAAREETMSLLQAGDCTGAVRAALGTGDLEFATQVRTFCASATPPQQ